MFFLKISNADMSFGEETLTLKFYITNEALLTTKQVQIVDLKEFVIVALHIENKMFVMHVAIRKQEEMPVHSKRQAQVGSLLLDKALTKVLAEYSDYNNIFSAENATKLPENTGSNKHAIKLEEDKQLLFGLIYSLGPVELVTLKTYIKINLVNGFIWPSKSSTRAPILFDKKSNKSFRLYIDYRGFHNITIKNRYPLCLIGKLLDWLGQAKTFTQLDLTNAYY